MNKTVNKYFIFIAVLISLLSSCTQKQKMIPEKDMGTIIVQTVLTESFLRSTGKNNIIDSTDIYLPILKEMGYTMEDFEYTFDKMIRRKSDVLSMLMVKMTDEVKLVKERYEYLNGMGRKWKQLVRTTVFDTLYFSPDSIRIKSLKDLSKLDFTVPLYQEGEYIVSYNYHIDIEDNNQSRYFIYKTYDSLTNNEGNRSYYWLSRNNSKYKFEKELAVRNIDKFNKMKVRIFSTDSNFDKDDNVENKKTDKKQQNIKKSKKTVENITNIYIDSVMIRFRPKYEIANIRLMERYRIPKMLYDFGGLYRTELDKDSLVFKVPYKEAYYIKPNINSDLIKVKLK